jgi:hypothetical protein
MTYITLLSNDDFTEEEKQKISAFISHSNKLVEDYFSCVSTYDIVVRRTKWEMEVQVMSRIG